uniref:BRO1 domain-containing protein n=1 Tax=Strongyloides venezuelensis TaxID=75913 RepID=A0A0K0FBF7_STRVS
MFGYVEKKVNGQTFIRWIDDSLRTITSHIPVYYHPNLLCDYIDDVDEELVKFHVALDNGTLDFDKISSSYEMLLGKFKKHKEEVNKLCRMPLNENNFEPRNELLLSDLCSPKVHPIFYTKNEEKMILSCNKEEFNAWFRSEICCILDFIDRYRESNTKYEFPTNADELGRRAEIKNTMSTSEYENELMHLYQRVLLVYSLIFSKYTQTTAFKQKIIKETNFLKQLLFSIAEEMDFRCIRINYFINSYKLYVKGLNEQNENIKNLSDDINIRSDDLKLLEKCVSKYFKLEYLETL